MCYINEFALPKHLALTLHPATLSSASSLLPPPPQPPPVLVVGYMNFECFYAFMFIKCWVSEALPGGGL